MMTCAIGQALLRLGALLTLEAETNRRRYELTRFIPDGEAFPARPDFRLGFERRKLDIRISRAGDQNRLGSERPLFEARSRAHDTAAKIDLRISPGGIFVQKRRR
jgi:hypothetical protein